jgi:hypothetical protein
MCIAKLKESKVVNFTFLEFCANKIIINSFYFKKLKNLCERFYIYIYIYIDVHKSLIENRDLNVMPHSSLPMRFAPLTLYYIQNIILLIVN